MNEKIGRNDPCSCGSGKKFKNCCLHKEGLSSKLKKHKLTAKWLNAPEGPNLMERTYGEAISSTGRIFEASKDSSGNFEHGKSKEGDHKEQEG